MKQSQESSPVSQIITNTRAPAWLRKWRWGQDGGCEAQDGAADIWAVGQSAVWNGRSSLAAPQLPTKVTADGADATGAALPPPRPCRRAVGQFAAESAS